MSTISLKVELMAGSHIERAAVEMRLLSERLGVRVEADFNGVTLLVDAGGSDRWLATNYAREMEKEGAGQKIASNCRAPLPPHTSPDPDPSRESEHRHRQPHPRDG